MWTNCGDPKLCIMAKWYPTIIYHDVVKVDYVNLLACLTWKKGQKILSIMQNDQRLDTHNEFHILGVRVSYDVSIL